MNKNDVFSRLIQALRVFPNVGIKTAQRMAFTLLQQNRTGANELLEALTQALQHIHHCQLCHSFCQGDLCDICADTQRDSSRLMVVQMPADVASMELAKCHDGLYFVLMGQINPAQGADLHHIALQKLLDRLHHQPVQEIVLAMPFTAEGDATAFVIVEALKNKGFKISRLARGMPLGSELEYVDAGTLAQAVYKRSLLHTPKE